MLYTCDWGLPTKIISDRDPEFLSKMWDELFLRLGVRLLKSTAYHPRIERLFAVHPDALELDRRYPHHRLYVSDELVHPAILEYSRKDWLDYDDFSRCFVRTCTADDISFVCKTAPFS